MSSKRHKKSECAHENCGSRRFHSGDDGFVYCDQGHQQSERGTAIADDTGEFVVLGRKSRRVDSDAESATSRASSFSGSHAFEHYLHCVQTILIKQLHWLINVQKLPDELEDLVKDLWTLRLEKAQGKISHDSETDTEAPSSQVFSSQSESEATTATRSTRRSRKRNEQVKGGSPTLADTLSCCYIGTLLLRIPITIADIHRWTSDGELLYYRAVQQIPLDMRSRLPPRYQALLEPQSLLQASSLHANVLKMLKTFEKDSGLTPPRLNVPLVLCRWLRDLMLPIEIYNASQTLANFVNVNFDFVLTGKSGSSTALRYPEVQIMAVAVVATKLLFPFDLLDRQVKSNTDLSVFTMDWNIWAEQLAIGNGSQSAGQQLPFHQSFDFNETNIMEATDARLDSYLDWYQENIANEDIRDRGKAGNDAELRRALFTMFPLHREVPKSLAHTPNHDRNTPETQLGAVQSKMRLRQTEDTAEESYAIGSRYRRYRSANELSGVPELFFERAASLAGLSIEEMVQAVFAVERKLQKYEERLRKQAVGT